jgi:UDP-4-amino-4-deoxy-L-arabinose-oxoglutarate aminotransferase
LADFYLSALPTSLTEVLAKVRHRWHGYRFPLNQSVVDFDSFARRLMEHGVTARRGVDALLHKRAGMADPEFPNAVRSFRQTVSIPIYPALTDQEAERVVRGCNLAWNQGS